MGLIFSSNRVICEHRDLVITKCLGPSNPAMKYADEYTSYGIDFARLTCDRCNMDFYAYNSWRSDHPRWQAWTPENDDERTPLRE